MNELDREYQLLLGYILGNGTKKETRNGSTISVFGEQIRHKMSDGFPLLTTKKIHFKSIVTELLWFLRGDTNIKYLVDNGVNIWNGDAYKRYLNTYKGNFELDKEEFVNAIKTSPEFAKQWGELGPIYGKQWRKWKGKLVDKSIEFDAHTAWVPEQIDQIQNLINNLKTNPDSRRLMVNAWNVGELDQMVLPPCHYGFQVYTRELGLDERRKLVTQEMFNQIYSGGRPDTLSHSEINQWNVPTRAISLMWNQRSVDTFLGLPFNIASYGLLLEIIAKEVNMVPDELIGNLGDCHLYLSDHVDAAKEQISREPFELPKLTINENNKLRVGGGIFTYVNTDFTLENYKCHPKIKATLSN
jgi:thymidylate synthase